MGEPSVDPVSEVKPAVELTKDDRMWAMFAHLFSMIGYVAPLGHIIAPLVVWLIKKDTSKFVNFHGRESLNFQICMIIYVLVSIPIGIFTCGIGFILTAAIAIFDLVMVIIASVKANSGEYYRYPLIFRMV
jgi:uncharacterized Tic20 family protein